MHNASKLSAQDSDFPSLRNSDIDNLHDLIMRLTDEYFPHGVRSLIDQFEMGELPPELMPLLDQDPPDFYPCGNEPYYVQDNVLKMYLAVFKSILERLREQHILTYSLYEKPDLYNYFRALTPAAIDVLIEIDPEFRYDPTRYHTHYAIEWSDEPPIIKLLLDAITLDNDAANSVMCFAKPETLMRYCSIKDPRTFAKHFANVLDRCVVLEPKPRRGDSGIEEVRPHYACTLRLPSESRKRLRKLERTKPPDPFHVGKLNETRARLWWTRRLIRASNLSARAKRGGLALAKLCTTNGVPRFALTTGEIAEHCGYSKRIAGESIGELAGTGWILKAGGGRSRGSRMLLGLDYPDEVCSPLDGYGYRSYDGERLTGWEIGIMLDEVRQGTGTDNAVWNHKLRVLSERQFGGLRHRVIQLADSGQPFSVRVEVERLYRRL